MSSEGVSAAILEVTSKGVVTAAAFQEVSSAVGQYQDYSEYDRINDLLVSMNRGVIKSTPDGYEAVKAQVAKGNEIAKAISDNRGKRGTKANKFSRFMKWGFGFGFPGIGTGYVLARAGIAVHWLVGVGALAVGVIGTVVGGVFQVKLEKEEQRFFEALPD